jgi:propionyl-CoA carboxylase alpha chain
VWTGFVGGQPVAAQVRTILNGIELAHAGASAQARVYTRREAELAALMPEKLLAGAGKQLLCPMPGLVKAILVKAGQEVKAGEPLAIVEAMKMENVLRAERDASVATIAAKEGESLAVDAVILEFA